MAAASELFAEAGIAGGYREEAEAPGEEDDVEHVRSGSFGPSRRKTPRAIRAGLRMWAETALGFERDGAAIL